MTAMQPIVGRTRTPPGEFPAARIFLLFAPLIFAAYALLTPPFQTPDEHQHLFRAWQLSELRLFGERRGDIAGGVLPDAPGRAALQELGTIEPHAARAVVRRPISTVWQQGTPPNTGAKPRFYNFVGSVIYSPAGYSPQVAAIWLGRATGLSVENIVRLGRLLNAALTILLIYGAIRLTPVGGLSMAWVGLFPMTASTSASFGQDGLVIGGACLLTAVGLRVLTSGRWRRSDLLITSALTILVTLSKLLYLPLTMIGAQPFFRAGTQWRRLLAPSLVCFTAAALAGLWMHSITGLIVPPQADIPPADGRVAAWLRHPTELLMLLERTYVGHGGQLFDTLFTFGWLTVGPVRSAAFLSIASLALVLVAGDPAADRLTYQTRVWLSLVAVSIVLLMSVALYLYWTRASDTWIQGLQGRYFIPILPALLMALVPRRDPDAHYDILVALLMLSANLISIGAIVRAFYSF